MTDLAKLGIQFEAQGADQVARATGQVAAAAKEADSAVGQLDASNRAASASFAQAATGADKASASFMDYAKAALEIARAVPQATREALAAGQAWSANNAGMKAATDGAAQFTKGSGAMREEMEMTSLRTARMGREFVELGGMMVSGIAEPTVVLNILISMFAHASESGMSFAQVIGAVGKSLVPFLGFLGTIGVVAGVAFGAASLGARKLNQDNQDLVDSLGLTEKQMKRLEDKGAELKITIGDVFGGLADYIKSSINDATQGAQQKLSNFLDEAAHFFARFGAAAVGAFTAGFEVIKVVWSKLPEVIGEAITGAVNATLKGVQMMINGVIDGINKVVAAGKGLANQAIPGSAVAQTLNGIGTIGHVELPQFANPNAGACASMRSQLADAPGIAARHAVQEYDKVLDGIGKAIVDHAKSRIRDEAGDPGKERQPRQKQAPTDRFDQQMAQLQAAQLQAEQEGLSAQLAVTKDLTERAKIQTQIIDLETQTKNAQIDKTIAEIQHDKGMTDAEKGELTAGYEALKLKNDEVGSLKNQAQLQQIQEQINRNKAELEQQDLSDTLDLLKAKQDSAKSDTVKYNLSLQVQDAQFALDKKQLEDTTLANGYTQQQVDIAQKRLAVIDQIQAEEKKQLLESRTLSDDFHDAQKSIEDIATAFGQRDWTKAVQAMIDAIQKFVEVMSDGTSTMSQKIASLGGILSGIGNAVGGSIGKLIGGAGQAFGVGGTVSSALGASGSLGFLGLGSLAGPLGIVAGIGSFIGSLFGGGDAAKKAQERRDAENQAAEAYDKQQQTITDQKRDLETRLVQASGDAIAILAQQRAVELQGLDAANQDLAKQVYDAEDRQTRSNQLHDIELKYLDLTGDKVAQLNAARQDEAKTVDATLVPLLALKNVAEDASTALDDAKTALQNAYDAENTRLQNQLSQQQQDIATATDVLSKAYDTQSSSLNDLISKFTDFSKSLKDFGASLDTGSAAGLSPQNQYLAAQSSFNDISAKAQMGDQDALSQFQTVAQDFLSASQAYNGVSPQYYEDLAAVKAATQKAAATADRTVDNANQQLDQLKLLVKGYIDVDDDVVGVQTAIDNLVTAQQAAAQTQAQIDALNALVDPLLGINQSVLSVGDAVAQYGAAQQANADAINNLAQAITDAKANPANQPIAAPSTTDTTGYISTNGDYAAYVEGNPDLKALFVAQTGYAKGRTEAEFGEFQWATIGHTEPRPVRPYARGGEFMVGGVGGVDSQHVEFAATPDEHVTVKTPDVIERETQAQERQASAMERLLTLTDQLLTETKAGKTHQSVGFQRLIDGITDVAERVDGVKRTVRGKKAA